MSAHEQLIETFAINNRTNLYLLEAIREEHLADVYTGSKGRNAGKHEAHHRGQIMIILKQDGHLVDKKVHFGIWEWGVR